MGWPCCDVIHLLWLQGLSQAAVRVRGWVPPLWLSLHSELVHANYVAKGGLKRLERTPDGSRICVSHSRPTWSGNILHYRKDWFRFDFSTDVEAQVVGSTGAYLSVVSLSARHRISRTDYSPFSSHPCQYLLLDSPYSLYTALQTRGRS
jgi:hypothetical protein